MYELLQKLHSWWAYLALIVLLIAVVNALIGYASKKSFESKDLRISLFALIFTHVQLLLGLAVFFVSEKGIKAFGIEGAMKNSELRLTMLEHPLINIIAIVLITIGWSKHKKVAQELKFRKILFFYGIGLLLILSRLPWSSWLA
ncbi:MAG TPA: hypothetical protein PLL09_07920 [Flavobacterium sp.]|uniref:hypothetical protein n=1 Tax=unclassified Flavobacterium TaxID=196869 RepID=UPI000E896F70|nr:MULTISPECIES: hypothetical protein [unclassified Flavobacterium]HBI01284.1 hypothetical protein [Flavobacterium sp.]HRE77736.1 hypothetical protein [Flavobacterium sp.]